MPWSVRSGRARGAPEYLIAVSNALSAPARFLSWPLERRLTDVTDELMQSVVEYFQGRWADETRETIGTVRTIVLPTTQ